MAEGERGCDKNDLMKMYEELTGGSSLDVDHECGCWVRSESYVRWLEKLKKIVETVKLGE